MTSGRHGLPTLPCVRVESWVFRKQDACSHPSGGFAVLIPHQEADPETASRFRSQEDAAAGTALATALGKSC